MNAAFDFTTEAVLDWEIEQIHRALDQGQLLFSRHALNELFNDALTEDEALDAISFYDHVSKDFPNNEQGRAAGINFEQTVERGTLRVKVGWRGNYLVITSMIL
ncbi:hypothetical protein FNU79_10330 [Deinococcus detaillensis]|uniref:DUF4258 domain-containing protein n=1 Tax=Deinococcus detaillensis TaxID=2592048 RepID=A0A553UWP3_9DEIO|nr:hypothetical protein [Deinococcus detaillensis]TSA84622.1 hypothetical protein FNU79_10330 [Deinococcus detaillensis]